MIPAVPNTGTADTNPLVTFDDYTRMTRDTASSQDDFDYFLTDALDQLQREMRRTFLYAQYTERLFLYKNGQVYPSAVPLDATKPVQAPATADVPSNNVGVFQGNGIWVGWFIPLPSLPVWQGVVPPQTDITYWGGWVGATSALAPVRQLPAPVKRAICKTVWFMLNPAALTALPGGVKSTSVGGVNMSGDLSSFITADDELRRIVKRWRLPQAVAWDAQTT